MRRWRFWLGTETILHHETLEVLAWDRDVGGSGMGQRQYYNMRRWRFWLETDTILQHETLEVLACSIVSVPSQNRQRLMLLYCLCLKPEPPTSHVIVLSLSQARTSNVSCCSIVSGGSGLGQRQYYTMSCWRFWLGTETILQHETLEVLASDRDNTT
jgi:hypothetical protein